MLQKAWGLNIGEDGKSYIRIHITLKQIELENPCHSHFEADLWSFKAWAPGTS